PSVQLRTSRQDSGANHGQKSERDKKVMRRIVFTRTTPQNNGSTARTEPNHAVNPPCRCVCSGFSGVVKSTTFPFSQSLSFSSLARKNIMEQATRFLMDGDGNNRRQSDHEQ